MKQKINCAQLAKKLKSGDRRTLSKAITLIEDGEDVLEIFEHIESNCESCHRIGITGPPGAGKSTLVDGIISHLRQSLKKKVGIIAVDPSSPFSGGALLGDRIRMQGHYSDEGVFIRSLSTRGHRGGISFSARLLARLYEGFGFDYVIIETVGVGQSEVDIMELADTTVVVLVPESGDTIQTMKAGLLEIADIFVVNKCERDGAVAIADELKQMIALEDAKGWLKPVLMTQASTGKGITELFDEIEKHARYFPKEAGHNERVIALKKREILEIALAKVKGSLEEALNDASVAKQIENDVNSFNIAKKVIADIVKA